jgi:Flp pilus assembly protein TadG
MKNLVRKFASDQKGVTAIEFAMVAPPFFMILFGILELAFILIINSSLNMSVASFSRNMRTGQMQAAGLSAGTSGAQISLADAKTLICSQLYVVSGAACAAQLQLDIRPLTSFGNTATSNPISGTTFNSSTLCYYSGNAGDIVEIRAYYLYSISTPFLLNGLAMITNYVTSSGSASGNYFPIADAEIYKSELFSGQTNSGAGC